MAADGGRVMSNEWDAFISYSRQATRAEAESLQARLQTFAKPWNRLRSARVFRDDASMSANAGLWPTIERALVEARYFILILSPAASASQWVDNEVRWWLHYKGAGSILLVHAAGTVGWDRQSGRFSAATDCVPPALSATLTEEPRWVDLTWFAQPGSTGAADPRFQEIVADLAAPIRGVERDELVGEHVAQLRRTRRFTRVGISMLVVLLVIAILAAVMAISERHNAIRQRDEAYGQALIMASDLQREQSPALATALAAEALLLEPIENADGRRALIASQQKLDGAALRQVGDVISIPDGGHITGMASVAGGAGLVIATRDGLSAWLEPRAASPGPSIKYDAKSADQVLAGDHGDGFYAGGHGGVLRYYDSIYASSLTSELQVCGSILAISVSPDRDFVAVGCYQKLVLVSTGLNGQVGRQGVMSIVGQVSFPPGEDIYYASFLAGGTGVVASHGTNVTVFDIPLMSARRTIAGFGCGEVCSTPVAVGRDVGEFFVSSSGGVLRVNVDSGETVKVPGVRGMIATDEQGRLLTQAGRSLSVYDPKSGVELARHDLPDSMSFAMHVGPIGPGMIGVAGPPGQVVRFAWAADGLEYPAKQEVRAGTFSLDGAALAFSDDDGYVRLHVGEAESYQSSIASRPTGFAFLTSGNLAIASRSGGELVVVSVTGKELRRASIGSGEPWFSNGSALFALRTSEGIEFIDAESGTLQSFARLPAYDRILDAEFIPSADAVVISLDSGTAVWNPRTGEVVRDLGVGGRTFSRAGIVTLSDYSTTRILSAKTWEDEGPRIPYDVRAVHPDGDLLVFEDSGDVTFWDRSAGRIIGRVSNSDFLEAVEISEDGQRLMIISSLSIDAAGSTSAQPARVMHGLWDPGVGCARVQGTVTADQVRAVGPKGWVPRCSY